MKNSDYEIVQMLPGHAESLMEQATRATGASGGAVGQDGRCPAAAHPAGPLYRSAWPDFVTFSRAT
jgi:hypothetical protein